jgi:lipopolysaccharide export system protein LptC
MRWTNRGIWRLLPIALAVLFAVFIWWPLSQEGVREAPVETVETTRADYYLTDFSLTRSDASGRWQYELEAQRLEHYPESDSWALQAPAMTLYMETGAPWYGRGERGRVWADGELARLEESVELWRPASAQNRASRLETRDVLLKPGEHYAETAAPVVLSQAGRGQLRGTGARAYLQEERYELLSNVKGSYAPVSD